MKSLIFVLLVSTCGVSPETPTESAACGTACAHWEKLGCEVAEPDSEGNTCVFICEETQKAGLIDLEPEKAEESETCP